MSKVTSRITLLSAIMGFSLGAVAAAGNVYAAEDILNDAIHDYSNDASRSFQSSPSQRSWGGYDMKIVLDESYHDYNLTDVVAFESGDSGLERADFAAFEENSSDLPWVSEVY